MIAEFMQNRINKSRRCPPICQAGYRPTRQRRRWWACLALLSLPPVWLQAADIAGGLEEIVVTAQRRQETWLTRPGNAQRLGAQALREANARHPHELFTRAAGAWVMRGSGQEHQLSLRSPMLGGAGGCGSVLLLEDGVPIRPTGFCNINQMAELALELADSVEVIRGPASAMHGSNAVHGVINVVMPGPDLPASAYAVEAGANGFWRGSMQLPVSGELGSLSAVWAADDGFRDASGYRQAKVHAGFGGTSGGGSFAVGFTATNLRQDTAGFIYGKDAYLDERLSATNPDAGAFRDMDAQRLYGRWAAPVGRFELDLRPYLRHSSMSFMHWALPGRPIEDNSQLSAGILSMLRLDRGATAWSMGVDLEWASIDLRQAQQHPAEGPSRIRETRPVGLHYDYDVVSVGAAPFLQVEHAWRESWRLTAGVRWEYVHYDYSNHLPDGNTRDDGQPCGFGGCFYTRPADRDDRFSHLAPSLGVSYLLSENATLFLSLAQGFRVPQSIELYRLQSGQVTPDLEPERIDALELGWRGAWEALSFELTAFLMHKKDSVYRDAEGFNVSGARSRHRGVEAAVSWQPARDWWLSFNASYARHTYDFDYVNPRGESFVSGNDMDTAPRWLGGMDIRYEPTASLSLGLQWVHLGRYFLEPRNRFTYPGHDLLNLRAAWRLSARSSLVLRCNNVLDERVADRADYGRGDYRYLPGRGREWFAEWRVSEL
jgi:outer membrane receptor protein involved in Fe transport